MAKSILKPHSLNQYFSKDFVECFSCKNKIEDDFFLRKWKNCLRLSLLPSPLQLSEKIPI